MTNTERTKKLYELGAKAEEIKDKAVGFWLAAIEAAGADADELDAYIETAEGDFESLKELMAEADKICAELS